MSLQRPRPIESRDVTAGFDSGESSLDEYLKKRALANHVTDIARCFVCADTQSDKVMGYYTFSAVSIERINLLGKARRNAPNPVPAALIGRLAVDRNVQGKGIGKFLVRDAILSTLRAADSIGIRILLVHAIHENAAEFYSGLGFQPSPTDPLHLYLLLSDARVSLAE